MNCGHGKATVSSLHNFTPLGIRKCQGQFCATVQNTNVGLFVHLLIFPSNNFKFLFFVFNFNPYPPLPCLHHHLPFPDIVDFHKAYIIL